jgi:hypothetical protein
MPCRRPRAILLIEGSGSALGELEPLSVNRHEEIAGATRNHLARQTVAEASHEWRPFALVADVAAVASASKCKFGRAHSNHLSKPILSPNLYVQGNISSISDSGQATRKSVSSRLFDHKFSVRACIGAVNSQRYSNRYGRYCGWIGRTCPKSLIPNFVVNLCRNTLSKFH